jgi:hypothetical protein
MVRVHYYSPYTADFNADLLLNKGARGTAAQRDLKGWYGNWGHIQPRLQGRGRGVVNEYTGMYGTRNARKETFRRIWRTGVSTTGSLENMARPLRRVGYWPQIGGGNVATWKKYTEKMFNSLIKYYTPTQLYKPLHYRVNRLIYRRAWKTATGSNLMRRTSGGRRRARAIPAQPPPPPPPAVAVVRPRRSSRIRAQKTQATAST